MKLYFVFIIIFLSQIDNSYNFATGGPFDLPFLHVHKDIAKNVLEHFTVEPYIEKYNLDAKKIAHIAAKEP